MAAPGDISTVAGTGTPGFSGDGGPATSAQLSNPGSVAITADGGFLITDQFDRRVRKVSAAGTITTVAGDGGTCNGGNPCGDGGPATSAQLTGPTGVHPTADGGFLIADWGGHRIRKVSATGTISTVAGTGVPGFSGDGGPATSAQLFTPNTVVTTADGGFLIADQNNHRIRKVSAAGTITTVAGDGSTCSPSTAPCGDGGAATSAQLFNPVGVATTADGGFLIADIGDHRIRKVSTTGMITTVAGTGTFCFPTTAPCGDGGPAAAAQLRNPVAVAATTDGGFLIVDMNDHRIRKVSATGTITTVAGTGVPCSPTTAPCGDGGPATAAQINFPNGIAPTADGGFLIADTSDIRIRKVEAAAPPPPQGKVSARGTVQTAQGPSIVLTTANNCNPLLSTQPSIVGTPAGTRIWSKISVITSNCSDQLPASPLGFDTQNGTATGTFGPAAPGGRNGQPGTLQWTYYDDSPDTVEFTLRDSVNNIVYQVNQQSPAAYRGSPGGVWTFAP